MIAKSQLAETIEKHLTISRDIGKHFMKTGKSETSVLIEHYADIEDGITTLKTRVSLLPVRRMYMHGSKIVDDEYLTYEMEEDVQL